MRNTRSSALAPLRPNETSWLLQQIIEGNSNSASAPAPSPSEKAVDKYDQQLPEKKVARKQRPKKKNGE